jgi:hypothetical protein
MNPKERQGGRPAKVDSTLLPANPVKKGSILRCAENQADIFMLASGLLLVNNKL